MSNPNKTNNPSEPDACNAPPDRFQKPEPIRKTANQTDSGFVTIPEIWNQYLFRDKDQQITQTDIAMMSALLRIVQNRVNAPAHGSSFDIAEYAAHACKSAVQDGKQQEQGESI